jgi:hypothetical protein
MCGELLDGNKKRFNPVLVVNFLEYSNVSKATFVIKLRNLKAQYE